MKLLERLVNVIPVCPMRDSRRTLRSGIVLPWTIVLGFLAVAMCLATGIRATDNGREGTRPDATNSVSAQRLSRVPLQSDSRSDSFRVRFRTEFAKSLKNSGFAGDVKPRNRGATGEVLVWDVRVPVGYSVLRATAEVISVVHSFGGNVYRAEHEYADPLKVKLAVGAAHAVTDSILLATDRSIASRGLLAIVIDDMGYRSMAESGRFADLPFPVNLAFLPAGENTLELAKRARATRKTILLHLPMEPENGNEPLEPNTIMTAMSDEEIRELTRRHLESIPGLAGVNNHMGSRATRDERVMRAVLAEVRDRNLFFLDSYTSPGSTAAATARSLGIPTLERDVFLDNSSDIQTIQRELWAAADKASRSGRAVAIGHDRPETYEALRVTIPAIQRSGVRVCFLWDLLR